MLESNNSNQNELKNPDLNMIHPSEMYWNKFDRGLLIEEEPEIIDINDKQDWTREEFEKILNQHKRKWILKNYKEANPVDVFRKIFMNFNICSFTHLCSQKEMKDRLDFNFFEIQKLIFLLDMMGKNDNKQKITKEEWDEYDENLKNKKFYEQEYNEHSQIIKKMKEILYYYGETLLTFSVGFHASSKYHSSADNIHKSILRKWIEPYDDDKNNDNEKDHQKLLRCLFEICKMKRYSKYNDLIYHPVFTKSGHYAYSCEKVDDIDHFVECQISRDNNPMLWDLAHKDKSTITYVKNHLKVCVDSSLPYLEKDRRLYSFNNGIYQLKVEKINKRGQKYYTDKFYPYDQQKRPKIRQGVVCCKYFNQEMDYQDYDEWYDIPTPNIQKIFDLQYEQDKEYDEICKWVYILTGRLLYEIGELEGWQVIAFMKGLAGTGKGTFIKAIQRFFDVEDVGVLSNDGQKQFSVSALMDKLLFVAPEIKGDLSLPQATFQSMISGEDISIDIKHKTAQTVTWKIPGILAGNEVPGWTDNSGSIARRLIIFGFNKKVPRSKTDPELWNKIGLEIPRFLRKCNLAYLDAVNKWKSKNIWSVLPEYFTNRKKELSEQTNDLIKFLRSPGVLYGKNYYISEKEFINLFNEYVKKDLGKRPRYNREKLIEPFQSLGEEYNTDIAIVKIDRRKRKMFEDIDDNYPEKRGVWIRGMTIQDEEYEIQEDANFVDFLKCIEKKS